MENVAVLIVAAGTGSRFGGKVPKQYIKIKGKSIIAHSIEKFLSNSKICAIQPVINLKHKVIYDDAISDFKILDAIGGGRDRQESVRIGLESLSSLKPDFVIIHDAARPSFPNTLVSEIIEALKSNYAVIPVLPVTDSLIRSNSRVVTETLNRSNIYKVQTPQGFHFKEILEAHKNFPNEGLNDDSAVIGLAGIKVKVIKGSPMNKKITNPEDILNYQNLEMESEVRTGFGFDVHDFKKGDKIVLCGLALPFDRSLSGHSDADVGLHALTDALLGAIGKGDIGEHFPSGESKWKGVSSKVFVSHAKKLIDDLGGEIINVDITLICELPKISPHRERMCREISEILKIHNSRINVKASTTEKLGFTGRSEGICAQAVANVRLKKGNY